MYQKVGTRSGKKSTRFKEGNVLKNTIKLRKNLSSQKGYKSREKC